MENHVEGVRSEKVGEAELGYGEGMPRHEVAFIAEWGKESNAETTVCEGVDESVGGGNGKKEGNERPPPG